MPENSHEQSEMVKTPNPFKLINSLKTDFQSKDSYIWKNSSVILGNLSFLYMPTGNLIRTFERLLSSMEKLLPKLYIDSYKCHNLVET